MARGTAAERTVPIRGRLLVGRACEGAGADRCLVLDDPAVSRDHLEIVVGARGARLVDLSSNGTYVNDRLVERGATAELKDGDRIELGATSLEFRCEAILTRDRPPRSTVHGPHPARLAIVVGDIVGYTVLTERHGGVAVATATDSLFAALATLVASHRGTVRNLAGDAMFAAWDLGRDRGAAAKAVQFALAAHELVQAEAPELPIRDAAGAPLRMGWAVTAGEAAIGRPRAGRDALHGPAVILGFRLSSLAARDGQGQVLVTDEVAAEAPSAASYGSVMELTVKGLATGARVRSAGRR